MGTFGLLKKFLKLGMNSMDGNDRSKKEYIKPIFSQEIPGSSIRDLTEENTDDETLGKIPSVAEQPESETASKEKTNKSVSQSKPVKSTSISDLPVGQFIHTERSQIGYTSGILKNTFIHLKGIGHQTEASLWEKGVLTHEDALDKGILATRRNCLKNSKQDIENRNWHPFYEGMNSRDHWRLFGDLVHETAYIDIETTGLGSSTDIITTAVVHSLRDTHVFVNGINLDRLPIHLTQFKLIVTYNGKSFDIPFIERFFQTTVRAPHIDLRYVLAGMGYKGGLKSCEQQLKLPNREGMEEIDGYTAVLLWNYYCRTKDSKALETLLAYNYEDSVRLEWLMIEAYNQKLSGLPFLSNQLHKPTLPPNPYKTYSSILRRI